MLSVLLFAAIAVGTSAHDTMPARAEHARATDPRAAQVLDTAIARAGGRAALAGIQRVRLEMLTMWQRTTFEERPYADAPSYELHSDLRDYTTRSWRNTRRFNSGPQWREITDIVNDTVGARRFTTSLPALPGTAGAETPAKYSPWTTLNVAYVDERREQFAFAPERVLLLARDAADLRSHP